MKEVTIRKSGESEKRTSQKPVDGAEPRRSNRNEGNKAA
jgi:hypothetical protein